MEYNKIEDLRKKVGLSQEMLAKKAGISTQGYYAIVKKHTTTIKNLEKISEALNVPMTYWFEDSDSIAYQENELLRKKVDHLEKVNMELMDRIEELKGRVEKSSSKRVG